MLKVRTTRFLCFINSLKTRDLSIQSTSAGANPLIHDHFWCPLQSSEIYYLIIAWFELDAGNPPCFQVTLLLEALSVSLDGFPWLSCRLFATLLSSISVRKIKRYARDEGRNVIAQFNRLTFTLHLSSKLEYSHISIFWHIHTLIAN